MQGSGEQLLFHLLRVESYQVASAIQHEALALQGMMSCPLCAGYEMRLRPPDPVNGPPEEPATDAIVDYIDKLRRQQE